MTVVKGVKLYLDLVKHLKDDAEARVEMLVSGAFAGDTPDVLELTSAESDDDINQAFDRSDLDNAFKEEQKEQFTVAKKIGISAQADFIAGIHKASLVRFRSRIKSLIVGGLRDAGQTTSHGYISFALQQLPLTEQTSTGADGG